MDWTIALGAVGVLGVDVVATVAVGIVGANGAGGGEFQFRYNNRQNADIFGTAINGC